MKKISAILSVAFPILLIAAATYALVEGKFPGQYDLYYEVYYEDKGVVIEPLEDSFDRESAFFVAELTNALSAAIGGNRITTRIIECPRARKFSKENCFEIWQVDIEKVKQIAEEQLSLPA